MARRPIADPLVPIEIAITILFGLLGAFVAVVILSLLVDDGGTTTALGGLGDGPVCVEARHSEVPGFPDRYLEPLGLALQGAATAHLTRSASARGSRVSACGQQPA
jgi:hypothetical protein